MFQRQPMLYFMLAAGLGSVLESPSGTGFAGMKGSWERPLVMVLSQWQLKLRFNTMKRAYKRLLAKVQPTFSRSPSVLEQTTKNSSHNGMEPARVEKTSCMCRVQSWRSELSPEDHEWIPDIVLSEFDFALFVICALIFPSWSKNVFCWSPQLRDWILKNFGF